MRRKNRFSIIVILIFWATSAYADGNFKARYLSEQEIERVRVIKEMLAGIDKKSLNETIVELEKTRHPLMNIQMKEAMAKAYTDIVREVDVEGQKKKEWLYSMVCLNMAYLQFGGGKGTPGDTTSLNRLIRQKLIEYLPSNISKQSGFLYSLD